MSPPILLPRPREGQRTRPPDRHERRPWRVALLVGAAVTTVMLVRLFAGGVVGLGDQGDGQRLLCSIGVADTRAADPSGAGYLHPRWYEHHWYGDTCGVAGTSEPYHSTELWLLWPAKYLSAVLFGDDGGLDLRALGVLCSVLAGLLCAGLLAALRGPLWVRMLVAGGIGMAFADSSFAGYFVSAYSEPAALLGTAGTLLALTVIWRRGYTTVPTLLFVAAGALFTIGAETAMAGFLLPITIGVLTVPYGGFLPLGRATDVSWGRGRRLRWYGRRWPALAILALMAMLTTAHVAGRPGALRDQDRYAVVFTQILPNGTDRAADLERLGGDPTWASASGVPANAPNSLVNTPEYDRFLSRVTWFRIGIFYGSHPSRLLKAFYQGVSATAELRPKNLGSYPVGLGRRPYAHEERVPFSSWLFAVYHWANWLLVVELVLQGLAGLLVIRHETLPRWTRTYGHMALWLAAAVPACLWTASLTGGGDMACVAFMVVMGLPILAACMTPLFVVLKRHGGRVAAVAPGTAPPNG